MKISESPPDMEFRALAASPTGLQAAANRIVQDAINTDHFTYTVEQVGPATPDEYTDVTTQDDAGVQRVMHRWEAHFSAWIDPKKRNPWAREETT